MEVRFNQIINNLKSVMICYSKDQLMGMSAEQADDLLFQKNVKVSYKDGRVRFGKIHSIEYAINTPNLPVVLRLREGGVGINIMDDSLEDICVL